MIYNNRGNTKGNLINKNKNKMLDNNWNEKKIESTDVKETIINNSEVNEVTDSTLEQVDFVLDFTKEEKAKIAEMNIIVNTIDNNLDLWKKIYASFDFWRFTLMYKSVNPKVKKYFELIYNEISIIWAEEKIDNLLNHPLHNGQLDSNIDVHIETIRNIEPDYDFSVFQSDALNWRLI